MKTNYLFLLLFLSIIVACNQKQPKKEPLNIPEGWTVLNEIDYSIQYPLNWNLDKSGRGDSVFGILSNHDTPEDQFSENVNLVIQDLTNKNINLDKFTEISLDQIKKMITNGVIVESSKQNIDGRVFQKVIYTGDFGGYNLTFEQYYFVKKNKVYVLTLTCETTQFEKYKETGERMLNSFRLN